MVDFIMQVVDYGITNLVKSPRYDLGCEIIGDLVHGTIMFLPTACQLLKGLLGLIPAMHWHLKRFDSNPNHHSSTAFGPPAAL